LLRLDILCGARMRWNWKNLVTVGFVEYFCNWCKECNGCEGFVIEHTRGKGVDRMTAESEMDFFMRSTGLLYFLQISRLRRVALLSLCVAGGNFGRIDVSSRSVELLTWSILNEMSLVLRCWGCIECRKI
jgi:hypothetical protein